MARKKLATLTRHYLSDPKKRLSVAVHPERIIRVVECEGYTTLHYAAKDAVHVRESFNKVMDEINAPRV